MRKYSISLDQSNFPVGDNIDISMIDIDDDFNPFDSELVIDEIWEEEEVYEEVYGNA